MEMLILWIEEYIEAQSEKAAYHIVRHLKSAKAEDFTATIDLIAESLNQNTSHVSYVLHQKALHYDATHPVIKPYRAFGWSS